MSARRLAGRVALVTGAASGIGRATAARLLEEGARVALADVDAAGAADAADELGGRGEVVAVPTDVADEASVRACLAAVEQRFGGLHALVNDAGIADPAGGPVEWLELAAWRRWIDVNLTGPFLMTKHAVPLLRRQAGSAIVNVASTRALMSEPHTEAYAASKGGLVALTHALALSLGPAVRANAVCPGWIDVSAWRPRDRRAPAQLSAEDHAQHPAGRVGRPEDVAALIAYLLSDEAAFVTGASFVIDGGMTRKMIYA